MSPKPDLALALRCPTCGAKPGEKCELGNGQPRTDPHPKRRSVLSNEKFKGIRE